jgi:Tol biopolymer transport system component
MAAADRDISDLYIKVVGANGESRLTNGPTDSLCPAWSPDGRFIAFLRKLGDTRNDLYLISPLGGSERKVAELETPLYLPCFPWHPSGKWLIVSHRKLPDSSFALFSISIDTGEERQLTFPPKESHVDRDPAVSPRGDAIVFARGGPGLVLADLYLLPLADGLLAKEEPRRLTFDPGAIRSLRGLPMAARLYFASAPPIVLICTKSIFPRWDGGHKPRLSAFAGEGVRNPSISGNGRLAFSRSTIRANIWRLELNGHNSALKPPEKLIASTHLDHTPLYSRDGKRIAFSSNRSGSHEIWLANSDGSSAMPLTSFGGTYYTSGPRWSPEGAVLFYSDSGGVRGPIRRQSGRRSTQAASIKGCRRLVTRR